MWIDVYFFLHSVTVTVSCSMEFLWYPFDCQKCELIFQTSKIFFKIETFFECNLINSIYFSDGLDITKQEFAGRIATSKNVISSQGALNYEDIITKENPNKTAPGVRKWKNIISWFNPSQMSDVFFCAFSNDN